MGACELVEKVGGIVVECVCVVALAGLGGKQKLEGRKVFTLIDDFMQEPTAQVETTGSA